MQVQCGWNNLRWLRPRPQRIHTRPRPLCFGGYSFIFSMLTSGPIRLSRLVPPSMFIGTTAQTWAWPKGQAPQSLGSMHTELVTRGYLSYDSNWGTSFPRPQDYIHVE